MSNSTQLLALFRGVITMMKVRGYNTKHLEPVLKYTPEIFENIFGDWVKKNPSSIQAHLLSDGKSSIRSMMSYLFIHNTNQNDKCLVYFAELGKSKSVSISEAATFGELYLKERCMSGILVSSANLSPQAGARLNELETSGTLFFQHFIDEDLLYDPTDCVWGSKARVLSPEEAEAFLRDNKIKPFQMPRIAIEGAVAKYYGVRPNQIMEFHRETFIPETLVDEEIFHRIAYRRPVEKKKK